jgi:hypothetical protein
MSPVPGKPGRVLRRAWLAAGAGFVALVVYLSLTPDPLAVHSVEDVKTGHVLAYFWLMLWFSQAWQENLQRLGLAVALVALGVALEYAQRQTGYRTFAYADMRDDVIGVAAGWVAASIMFGRGLELAESLYVRCVKFGKR